MPLRISGIERPRTPRVESDAYIPLSVDWVPVGSVRPIYYRAQAAGTGDIELKIEPLRGEIIGLVVIEKPDRQVGVPKVADDAQACTDGALLVDTVSWNPNADLVPTTDIVYEQCDLGVGEDEHHVYFALSTEDPDRFVIAGAAGFGIGPSGAITGILARKQP